MAMVRSVAAAAGIGLASFVIAACGSDAEGPSPAPTTSPPPPGNSHSTPHSPAAPQGGHWDENGQPVNGGPVGADGSTGNNLTMEYCAQNEDPGCPAGSYVGPNAILNPDGSNSYVPCEGTICTNPNHGAGGPPGDSQPPPDDTDAEPPVDEAPDGGDGDTG